MKKWVTALLIAGSGSYAGEFVVQGSGSLTCGIWTASRQTERDWHPHAQWIQGYIAASADLGASLRGRDQEAINLWVDGYCQQNPLNDIIDAARGLVNDLALRSIRP